MKIIKVVFLSILIVLLLAPVMMMNIQSGYASEITNAMLPEIDLKNDFSREAVDKYITERIGFHDEAITTYLTLYDRLFGVLEHPTYTYGKEGYTFFRPASNWVDTEFIDAFCQYLREIQDYCEKRGVPFLYCVNPAKITVYDEYLPEGYLYENRFLSALYEGLEGNGVYYISNAELLAEKARNEQVYNKKYDAGHWNDLGEFYATNHMLEIISKSFPSVRPWTQSDFEISMKTENYLPLSRFVIDEQVPQYTYRNGENVEDVTALYKGIYLEPQYPAFACFRLKDALDLPRVMFFHGSYYNRNRDFYKGAFSETYAIHNYENLLNFEYYFNIFQPDYVVLETAEYATGRKYFDLTRMTNKNLNPLLSEVVDEPHCIYPLQEVGAVMEADNALGIITFESDQDYKFGYLETEEGVFDLMIDGTKISCTVQLSSVNLEDAIIHLYQ